VDSGSIGGGYVMVIYGMPWTIDDLIPKYVYTSQVKPKGDENKTKASCI